TAGPEERRRRTSRGVTVAMRRFDTSRVERSQLLDLLKRPPLEDVEPDPRVAERTSQIFGRPLTPWQAVEEMVAQVAIGGDQALLRFARQIDGLELTPQRLIVTPEEWDEAVASVEPRALEPIQRAAAEIEAFHARQKPRDWIMPGPGGSL